MRRWPAVAGFLLIASAGVPIAQVNAGLQLGSLAHMRQQQMRIVHRVAEDESPTGQAFTVRRWHLYDAVPGTSEEGGIVLDMPRYVTTDRPSGAPARA